VKPSDELIGKMAEACQNFCVNEEMKKHTSFGIGGPTDFFCVPQSVRELTNILQICKEEGLPYYLLGEGSNTLVKVGGYRGVVISMKNFFHISRADNFVLCGSGTNLFVLHKFLKENGLAGLEFAYAIPGSVGGAIIQNAGAYGNEIGQFVKSVMILKNGQLEKMDKFWFSYRNSLFKQEKTVIISVLLELKPGNKKEIEQKQKAILKKRMESQPYSQKSAGSVFKRKGEIIPAKLIDSLGLKGAKIGGAEISEKHAGFIVNKGNAKAEDVLGLISKIKTEVHNNFGEQLQEEIEIIGEDK